MNESSKSDFDDTQKYINFPISILKCPLIDENGKQIYNIVKVISNIWCYGCYAHTANLEGDKESKIQEANNFYGVTFNSNFFDVGRQLFSEVPLNYPKAGISLSMLREFSVEFKTEFEKETFLAFCAIRSILQKQAYYCITKDYFVARMAGFPSSKHVNNAPAHIQKYTKRYHFNKMIKELTKHWGLAAYGNHTYGLYVSFKLKRKKLGVEAEMLKKRNKDQRECNERKLENDEIKALVKRMLEGGNKATP
jgi:hypothetical protein